MENTDKNIETEEKFNTEVKPDVKTKTNKRKLFGNYSLSKKHIPYVCLIIVGVSCIAVGLYLVIANRLEYAAARDEYRQLYDMFSGPNNNGQTLTPENPDNNDPGDIANDGPEDDVIFNLDDLAELNRDFIGWFSIEELIEYPVVQGADNVKYLNTTFLGQDNPAGTIFMDYRHANKWDEKVCIIYGHLSRDGAMFTPLDKYLNPSFLQEHNKLTITTRDGEYLEYTIFAAKLTDAWDKAYTNAFSNTQKASDFIPDAPEDATHFLLLSTCTRNRNPDERILVFAAR